MNDDIVTRLRKVVKACHHGNQKHYNAPEGAEVFRKTSCELCELLNEAANQIENFLDTKKQSDSIIDPVSSTTYCRVIFGW